MTALTVYIYALVDPRTDEIRYVGKSKQPQIRYKEHVRRVGGNPHKWRWIAELRDTELEPRLEILEESNQTTCDERERWWIASLRATGVPLTNIMEGGEGNHNPPPEVRKKMSQSQKKRMSDPAAREQLRQFFVGKPLSPEVRRKISLATKGKPKSEAAKEKMREAAMGNTRCVGRKDSEETRKKKSASAKGNKGRSGMPCTEEHKRKVSEAKKKFWEDRKARGLTGRL